MKKHSHFLLLILFNLNVYAFDACSEFLRIAKLESNQSTLSSTNPFEIPALQLKIDMDNVTIDSPGNFLRSDDNRVYPERILDENADYWDGDEVLSINGKKTSLMTDDEILDELFKDQDRVDIELILDGEFLVGKVVEVNYTTSRVLLLSDLNSKIPVTIEPDCYQSILSVTCNNDFIIHYSKEEISL